MTEAHSSTTTYLLVFAALLVLTGVTVAVAFVDLGGLNNLAALAVAGAKATLVVLWFMHVRSNSPLVRATVCAGGLWLAILIGLTLADYTTRSW